MIRPLLSSVMLPVLVAAPALMGAAWLARRRLPEDYEPTEVKANTQ